MTDKAKQFDWPPSYKVGGFGISEMEMKFAVQVADIKDEMILESCKEAARKAGVTDLTVIDRDSLVEYFAGQTNRQRFCPWRSATSCSDIGLFQTVRITARSSP